MQWRKAMLAEIRDLRGHPYFEYGLGQGSVATGSLGMCLPYYVTFRLLKQYGCGWEGISADLTASGPGEP